MSPREIVRAAVDAFHALFVEKNLLLTVDSPMDLPCVQADPPSINSALTNLLSNALNFTPAGGEVILSTESDAQGIWFSIADTGPGVPEEFRSRIFEKFFRVPVASGPKGAGLGLSITKEIVEAHDGRIEFNCPATGGTVVRFQLPVQTRQLP